MAGRKADSPSGKLRPNVRDALLGLWISSEDPLLFMDIHKGLCRRGIVKEKQKAATSRILTTAKKQGLVKHEHGSKEYFSNAVSEEFRVFDYLQRLREKAGTTRLHVGGAFWTLCQSYCIGLPNAVEKYPDISQGMLEILTVRISNLYEAFRLLAEEVKKRETLPAASHSIPYHAIRELMLELVPYFLGSRAGSDGDGLAVEDLNRLMPKMIEALPEEAGSQNPTCKDSILRYFEAVYERTKTEQKHWELEWQTHSSVEEKPRDFALIIVPPEDVADEDEQDKRWAKHELEDYAEKSPLYIASNLLMCKKENVDGVLDLYGRKLLGEIKLIETRKLYEKIHASNRVDSLIHSLDFFPEDKRKAMQEIGDLTEKHGRKSIIVYLAFSPSGKNWFGPTPEKEQLLQKFFPHHSKQEIHDWLAEGAEMHKPLTEEKIKDLEWRLKEYSLKKHQHD